MRRSWRREAAPDNDISAERVAIGGIPFPLHTLRRGQDAASWERAAANNLLLIDAPRPLLTACPDWRRVGARPRWDLVDDPPVWRRNDASWQRRGQHRWWGLRDHVRWWRVGDHVVGQAHREIWTRWPRRHQVIGLDAARDRLVASLQKGPWRVSLAWRTGAPTRQGDGRIAVVRFLEG